MNEKQGAATPAALSCTELEQGNYEAAVYQS